MWPKINATHRTLTTAFPAPLHHNTASTFVFFDAGMVLYDLDWDLFAHRVAQHYKPEGFQADDFLAHLSQSGAMGAWERGTIGCSQFCNNFFESMQFAEAKPGDLKLTWANPLVIKELSSAIIGNARPEVLELVKELKELKGVFTGILSNATAWHEADLLIQSNLRMHFDLPLFSQDFGLSKPDTEFYEVATKLAKEHVHSKKGHSNLKILFLDDTPKNVQGALDYGWDARLVDLLKNSELWNSTDIEKESAKKSSLVFGSQASERVLKLFEEFPLAQ